MIKVEQLISWGSNSVTNARWTKNKTKNARFLLFVTIVIIKLQVESCSKKIECQNKCRTARY